jgi:hypothetical protein
MRNWHAYLWLIWMKFKMVIAGCVISSRKTPWTVLQTSATELVHILWGLLKFEYRVSSLKIRVSSFESTISRFVSKMSSFESTIDSKLDTRSMLSYTHILYENYSSYCWEYHYSCMLWNYTHIIWAANKANACEDMTHT